MNLIPKRIGPQFIYSTFVVLQIFTILIYLIDKSNESMTFDFYLQSVKFSTLLLLFISILFILTNRNRIFSFDLIKYSFVGQIVILYFTMLIHTDIKAINSPTILLMLTSFIIFSTYTLGLDFINKITVLLAIVNLFFVVFQVINLLPVAQINERESFGITDNRPTGILFNAFALGYGSVILFLICLYFLINKQNTLFNIFGISASLVSIIFSATRTPLLLVIILSLLMIFQKNEKIYSHWKLVTISNIFFVILFPIVSVLYGNYRNLESYSNLNGRLFLWECVTSKWQEFIPFGVGVQAAFPKGFCSSDPWFANLRHPENMFLLNFVESGLIGAFGLIFLFVVAFYKSSIALKNANALPLALTTTYFMCSIFYVPLFHYLPFLENRPADRGIYNFFLFTLIWLIILVRFTEDKTQSLSNKLQ